jgi:iron complex outermembrane recepter protein
VPGESAALGADLGAGTFGARRGSLILHSGRRGRGPALWTRGSLIRNDGYRYHSGVRQRSLLFGGNVHTRGWLLALSGFTGREESGLAFLAAERAEVERDPRQNPLQPEEVDRFRQDLVQLQGARRVGTGTLVLQGYYNGVAGWYRLWSDPVSRLDLQQLGVDGRMLGARSSYTVSHRALTATLGLHAADFDRVHTLDAQGARRYANTGHKNEGNGFLKLAADRHGWHVDGELQLRGARFAYTGDLDLRPVTWTFLNARVGARRRLGEAASLYATLGRVRREPTRNDLFAGEDNPSIVYDLAAVRPERAVGIEAGGNGRWSRVTAHANVYTMQFQDEIALTGELSPIGLALRENVGRSFRRGVEADAAWEPAKDLRLVANGHWSVGRIAEWAQLYDVVEGGTTVGRSRRLYRDVPPLLSPGLTVNAGGEWRFRRRASVRMRGRYVSRSFLDNAGLAAFPLPASFDVTGTLEVELPAPRLGRPRLRLVGQNLLDSRQWASGYSASAIVREAGGERVEGTTYYFPLASRSVVAILSFRLGK